MKVKGAFSLTVSESLGVALTSTTEDMWSVSQTITTPPHSAVKAVWSITTTTTTGNYRAALQLPDYATWILLLKAITSGSFHSPALMPLKSCNINGPFTGIEGVSSITSARPLGEHC